MLYIRLINLAITIFLILNIWKCEKSKILLLLIVGFTLGRALIRDGILFFPLYEYGLPEDHDVNEDDQDTDGPSPIEEGNETAGVPNNEATNDETNHAPEPEPLTNGYHYSADEASQKMNGNLLKLLTQASIIIVSASASTNQGKNLTNEELFCVMEACQIAMKLSEKKRTILSYVESQMACIAPNLLTIVGSLTAAQLKGMAGDLKNLSKMSPCNISLTDAHKKVFGGLSSTTAMPLVGAIFYSKTVQDCPTVKDLRVRVARLVACKVTLAARVDSFHESPKGEQGNYLLAEIQRRLEKLIEPPLVKAIKALAPPIDPGRKESGRRRFKKMKERVGRAQLRTQVNQMKFGKIEEDAYQDAIDFSTGLIRKSGFGKVRAAQVDSKTKANISQKLEKTLERQNNTYVGTSTAYNRKQISEAASSVIFIPRQGLEIVNPNAA